MYRSAILRKIEDRKSDGKALLVILAVVIACSITAIISFRAGWDSKGAHIENNSQEARCK